MGVTDCVDGRAVLYSDFGIFGDIVVFRYGAGFAR